MRSSLSFSFYPAHTGSTGFTVILFVDDSSGEQFLKGYLFNGNRTRNPMGLGINKYRSDEYRREDGFREIWFVPSNQWLCGFHPGTQEWINPWFE